MKTPTEQLQLLEETIEYYSKNPRAIENSHCCYKTSNGHRCAIGRLLDDETLIIIRNTGSVSANDIWDKLPQEIRDFGINFLADLQALHDNPYNWESSGLSGEGKGFVNDIKLRNNLV